MTNFYFGFLLGKDVKKVTDTNDAKAKRKGKKKYRTHSSHGALFIGPQELYFI